MKKIVKFTFTEVKPMTKEESLAFQEKYHERFKEVQKMLKRLAKLYPNLGIKIEEE